MIQIFSLVSSAASFHASPPELEQIVILKQMRCRIHPLRKSTNFFLSDPMFFRFNILNVGNIANKPKGLKVVKEELRLIGSMVSELNGQ